MQQNELNRIQSGEMLPTKANIEQLAKEIIKRHENGELDAMQTYVRLTGVEQACDAAKKGLKQAVLEQLAKYPQGKGVILLAKAETAETGVKYDYSADAEWTRLDNDVKSAEAMRKGRETFLKGVTKPFDTIDTETAETVTIYPPVKTSTTAPKITLS